MPFIPGNNTIGKAYAKGTRITLPKDMSSAEGTFTAGTEMTIISDGAYIGRWNYLFIDLVDDEGNELYDVWLGDF